MRAAQAGSTWVVAAYFNAVGFASRLANYRTFRAHLSVPLLTMALEYGEPELSPADADILVRLTDGAVLWQKERLYNEALKYLPASCTKIIWLDADLIFPEPDWQAKVEQALDRYPVIQAFSRLRHERGTGFRDATKIRLEGDPDEWSAAALRNRNESVSASRLSTESGAAPRYIQGVAWATTRRFIEHCGFFDSTIIGSGDSAFWSAVSGDPYVFLRKPRTEGVVAAWQDWRPKAFEACDGRVGQHARPGGGEFLETIAGVRAQGEDGLRDRLRAVHDVVGSPNAALRAQDGRQQLLGGGLAAAAGDGDEGRLRREPTHQVPDGAGSRVGDGTSKSQSKFCERIHP